MPRQTVALLSKRALAVFDEGEASFTTIADVQNTFCAERSSYRNLISSALTRCGLTMCSDTIWRVRTCLAASRFASCLAVDRESVLAEAGAASASAATSASPKV